MAKKRASVRANTYATVAVRLSRKSILLAHVTCKRSSPKSPTLAVLNIHWVCVDHRTVNELKQLRVCICSMNRFNGRPILPPGFSEAKECKLRRTSRYPKNMTPLTRMYLKMDELPLPGGHGIHVPLFEPHPGLHPKQSLPS